MRAFETKRFCNCGKRLYWIEPEKSEEKAYPVYCLFCYQRQHIAVDKMPTKVFTGIYIDIIRHPKDIRFSKNSKKPD